MIKMGYGEVQPAAQSSKGETPQKGTKNNYSMNVRKISNGWLIRETWNTGEGKDQEFHEQEKYSAENPIDED